MRVLLAVTLAVFAAIPVSPLLGQTRVADGRTGIQAFNRRLEEATRRMDNTATLALWEDDGVIFLPATKPIIGKTAIRRSLSAAAARFRNAQMDTTTLQCFDVETSGAWGSEWCAEERVVHLADGTYFDEKGTMLLVLHRGRDGAWRLAREMWNQAAPDSLSTGRDTAPSDVARPVPARLDLSGAWATGSVAEPAQRRLSVRPACNTSPALWVAQQMGDSVFVKAFAPFHAQGVPSSPVSSNVAAGRVTGLHVVMNGASGRFDLRYDTGSGHLRGTLDGAPFWAVPLDVVQPTGCIGIP